MYVFVVFALQLCLSSHCCTVSLDLEVSRFIPRISLFGTEGVPAKDMFSKNFVGHNIIK